MLIERQIGATNWIDLTDPGKEELEALLNKHNLPGSIAAGCLDHDHLPRLEEVDGATILILRSYDLDQKSDQSSIQALTRKVTIVQKPGLLLTVHRSKLHYVQSVFDAAVHDKRLVPDLVSRVIKTYDVAIGEVVDEFDDLEEAILDRESGGDTTKVQDLYTLKRRVTLIKRILRMTKEPLEDYPESENLFLGRDYLEKDIFKLEEVYDNLIAILSLQISISGHRANEIMRVLTVYSILFLPLNLIAGIYGMNFQHMPELQWLHGYPMALIAMGSVGISILLWLRRKGWLDRPD